MEGAIVGLAVPAFCPTLCGYTPTVPVILLGSVLGAGGALLCDLDMSCSTATSSFGPITDVVSEGVQGLSRLVFRMTSTRADRARTKGTHRGLTHTGVGAVATGFLAWWLTSFGLPAALGTVFVVAFLALRGLPPVAKNLTDIVTAAAITALTWWDLTTQPVPAWWIGAAIGLGCLTHQAEDAMTDHGVPVLWPIPLGNQLWRPLGTPLVRFKTKGTFELGPLMWINTAALLLLLINLTPGGHADLTAILGHHQPTL
jgi:membrane-bound metal-dependent hydrolase YbcI (DUF457 family)